MSDVVSQDVVEYKILMIRGYKVILDKDLAIFYGVPPKRSIGFNVD